MQTLKVKDELHLALKRYCIMKGIKLEEFIDKELSNNKKLIEFEKQVQKLKIK